MLIYSSILLNPQDLQCELLLSKLAVFQLQYSLALQHCNTFLSYEYKNDTALFLKAKIYEMQNMNMYALGTINQAIELNQSNSEYYFARANILLALKQFEQSERDYNQSLDLNPTLEVYFNRGQVRRYRGNTDGACMDYDRAYKLGNTEALYYKNKYCKK